LNRGQKALQSYAKICSYVGKDHRVDNNVKSSLTIIAPTMRQMATGSIIAPSTINATFIIINPETETHCKSE
jgi:hypothetical protein